MSKLSPFVRVRVLMSLVTCFIAGCSSGADTKNAETEPSSAKPVSVEAVKIESSTLRPTLDLIGTIVAVPERIAVVSSQSGGWVEKVEAVDGQTVHRGDKLVLLDSRSAKVDVDRAAAMLAEKTSVLARLRRGYLPEEVEGARQDRNRARAAMEGLRDELAALKELQVRNEVSKVHWETKVKAFQQAEAVLGSAEAHLKLIEEGMRKELIDEAQSLLDVAKSDLEHSKLILDWCTVVSPINGVVVQNLARQGQFFDRAAPLATVMDLSEVFIQLRIPSADFAQTRLGSSVDVETASVAGKTFHGSITRLSGDADPLTGNVIVFAAVKNEGGELRPGMGCRTRVWLPAIQNALTVPTAAVADNNGKTVVTVIRDGKAHEIEVELGVRTHDQVQVVKGLKAGDMVTTAGGYGLPDDCPVQLGTHSGEQHAAKQ